MQKENDRIEEHVSINSPRRRPTKRPSDGMEEKQIEQTYQP